MSAGAFPDIEGGAPVAVAGNAPVLNVFEPVAEPAGADSWGNPVDLGVIFEQGVLDRSF